MKTYYSVGTPIVILIFVLVVAFYIFHMTIALKLLSALDLVKILIIHLCQVKCYLILLQFTVGNWPFELCKKCQNLAKLVHSIFVLSYWTPCNKHCSSYCKINYRICNTIWYYGNFMEMLWNLPGWNTYW